MVYPTRSKAIRDIASWIELEYNQKRLHSALGYRTPNEVDQEHRAVRQAARKTAFRAVRDTPSSPVGAEQSAGNRRLRAWLREARGWEAGSWAETASFLRAEGPGRRPGAYLCPPPGSTAVDGRLPGHHRCAAV